MPQLVTSWFKKTQADLAKFTGAKSHSKALVELGILGSNDCKDFHRLFKDSAGYEKAPVTRDPLKRADHKKKQLLAIMKFIEEQPLPS